MNPNLPNPRRAKKSARILLTSFGLLAAVAAAQAQVEIRTSAGSAPNVYTGDPPASGFSDWAYNAYDALALGKRDFGNRSLPTYFLRRTRFDSAQLTVTGFPSWLGKADPGSAFGSAFANQYGNRLHFVTLIVAPTGGKVDIANGVTYNFRSPAALNTGLPGTAGYDVVGASGSQSRDVTLTQYRDFYGNGTTANGTTPYAIGANKGPDGILGTSDDTFVYTGTGQVDAIFLIAPAYGFDPTPSPPQPPAGNSDQAKIEAGAQYVRGVREVAFINQVKYGSAVGTASAVLNPYVPVDLGGNYAAATSDGTNMGLASATTAPGGAAGFGKVIERSKNANAAATEGSLTPFSDAIKPPTSLGVDLTNKSITFNVDLGDPAKWSNTTQSAGELFTVGTGTLAAGLDNAPEGWVSFHREGGTYVVALQNTRYDTSVKYTAATDERRFRLKVTYSSAGTFTATITSLDGANVGSQRTITGNLPGGINLANSTFAAGFLSNALATSPEVTVSAFNTDAVPDALYTFSPTPYVKPGDTITYDLGMSNDRLIVSGTGYPSGMTTYSGSLDGYQAFLIGTGTGQAYGSAQYVGSPFPTVLIPPTSTLAYSAGLSFSPADAPANQESGGNAFLTHIFAVAGSSSSSPNTVGLNILASNLAGNPTRFSANQDALVPNRQNSNTVVIDDAAPFIALPALYRGGTGYTGTVTQGALQLQFSAADSSGTYSGLANVPTAVVTYSNGTKQALNVYSENSSNVRYAADFAITPTTPNGAATILITATDRVGNVTTNTVNLNINVAQVALTINLTSVAPPAAQAPLTRGVLITLGGTSAGTAPITLQRNVDFNNSGQATIVLNANDGIQPGTAYTQVSVKDQLHTLRRIAAIGPSATSQFSATLNLTSGDANDDNVVDILDYGIFASRYGIVVVQDTPYPFTVGASNRHPDFSGNGQIDTPDFSFISGNYLTMGDALPGALPGPLPGGSGRALFGGGSSSVTPKPKTTATVAQMLAAGVTQAKAMDRNRDGIVTAEEISNWMTSLRR